MPGLLTYSPADVIEQLLIDLSLGTDPGPPLVGDWPVYADVEPNNPDNCITCFDTVGVSHGRTMFDGRMQGMYGIQIRVRAKSKPVGWLKANAIAIAMSESVYQKIVHVSSNSYLIHSVTQVNFLESKGKDVPNTKRDLFFINCLVHIEEIA